jgi:hypothetical protein
MMEDAEAQQEAELLAQELRSADWEALQEGEARDEAY